MEEAKASIAAANSSVENLDQAEQCLGLVLQRFDRLYNQFSHHRMKAIRAGCEAEKTLAILNQALTGPQFLNRQSMLDRFEKIDKDNQKRISAMVSWYKKTVEIHKNWIKCDTIDKQNARILINDNIEYIVQLFSEIDKGLRPPAPSSAGDLRRLGRNPDDIIDNSTGSDRGRKSPSRPAINKRTLPGTSDSSDDLDSEGQEDGSKGKEKAGAKKRRTGQVQQTATRLLTQNSFPSVPHSSQTPQTFSAPNTSTIPTTSSGPQVYLYRHRSRLPEGSPSSDKSGTLPAPDPRITEAFTNDHREYQQSRAAGEARLIPVASQGRVYPPHSDRQPLGSNFNVGPAGQPVTMDPNSGPATPAATTTAPTAWNVDNTTTPTTNITSSTPPPRYITGRYVLPNGRHPLPIAPGRYASPVPAGSRYSPSRPGSPENSAPSPTPAQPQAPIFGGDNQNRLSPNPRQRARNQTPTRATRAGGRGPQSTPTPIPRQRQRQPQRPVLSAPVGLPPRHFSSMSPIAPTWQQNQHLQSQGYMNQPDGIPRPWLNQPIPRPSLQPVPQQIQQIHQPLPSIRPMSAPHTQPPNFVPSWAQYHLNGGNYSAPLPHLYAPAVPYAHTRSFQSPASPIPQPQPHPQHFQPYANQPSRSPGTPANYTIHAGRATPSPHTAPTRGTFASALPQQHPVWGNLPPSQGAGSGARPPVQPTLSREPWERGRPESIPASMAGVLRPISASPPTPESAPTRQRRRRRGQSRQPSI